MEFVIDLDCPFTQPECFRNIMTVDLQNMLIVRPNYCIYKEICVMGKGQFKFSITLEL